MKQDTNQFGAKKTGIPFLDATAKVGTHVGCGGDVFFRMDNPLGTYFCKRCNRVARTDKVGRKGFQVERKLSKGG